MLKDSMVNLTKTEAQKRTDLISVFKAELAHLEAEKVVSLTDEQRNRIETYHQDELVSMSSIYDIDRTRQEKHISLGMRVASFLGALALAASVFFFFYQFWGLMSAWRQITLLILAPMTGFAVTVFISTKDASGYFVKLAALVTFACFVLNISMLGQIFNVTPSDKAFIVWAAFAFLLAYTFDVRLLLTAGIVCITVFLSVRIGTWSGVYWLDFGERPENFLPVAILLMLFPQYVNHARFSGFELLYRVSALLIWFIPLLVLSNWGSGSYLNADPDFIEGAYQLAGFIFSGAVIWLGIRKEWVDVMNTGTVFFVIFLYTKFYDWWWEFMPKYLFFLVVGLTALLILFVFTRLRRAITLSQTEVTK